MSGPASALGTGMKLGMQAWFDGVNGSGGVLGRPIELVALDDGYEPARAASNNGCRHRTQDEMHVHRGDLEGLVAMLHAHQSNERILSLVQTWPEPRIEREFERLKDQALRLGERLGKPMQVEMVHNDLRMPKRFRAFWSSLVHAVRNALLHGIELPAQRQAAGKPSAGRLLLSAKQEGADTVIVIRDDGRGIDWEALSQTATRLGLPCQTHAQLVDALFAVGVSTASEVTDLAGRGVGMAAIKSEVDALNGSISVESLAKGGTTLHIRFRRSSTARSMVPPEVAA